MKEHGARAADRCDHDHYDQDLKALFQPMKVGPMTVPNRMMMAGMSAGIKVDENGEVDPQMTAYLLERARGEPGMIAIGASPVVPIEAKRIHGIALYSDHVVPSLRTMVEAVHRHDTRIGIQLWNGGGTEGTTPGTLISPSGLSSNVRTARGDATSRRLGQPNRALSVEDIHRVIGCFAQGARRAAEAGFDFVEIHGGHGYLISNFLTPLFNRRDDKYGGSFENRTRFLIEIVEAVRHEVGDTIAVGVKYNGSDFLGEDGWSIEESGRLAPLVEAAGADYITITAGLVGTPQLTIPPMYEPQGCYSDLAAAVKPHATVPVGTIGRIKNPLMARDLIASGKADFVCFGRGAIADPEIFAKTRRGAIADIRPCLADCRGCIDEHIHRHPGGADASCVVNPRMGRERSCIDVEGAARADPRRVIVVGGGLAGMEAARISAYLGHRVTLIEADDALGGQIRIARQIPGRQEIGDIVPWYERQLARLGVDLRLSTLADKALLATLTPDVIVLATGSRPAIPQNMIDLVLNAEGIEILLLDDLIGNALPLSGQALVIGGDQNGMVAADYLAQNGVQVTVAETGAHFGHKLAAHDRWYLLNRQNAKGVKRIKNVLEIALDCDGRVRLRTDAGEMALPDIGTIVFAGERKSDRTLAEATRDLGARLLVVGDAHDAESENAGTIFANIAHAYDTARQI